MANVTTEYDGQRSAGQLKSIPMSAVKIWKGTLVAINTSGYAAKGADTASFLFAGVAYETVDNSAGAAGDKKIRVEKTGEYLFNFSGTASQADLGKAVYLVDDNTVALAATTTNDVLCGYIQEFVSASTVRIRIDRAVQ